MKNARHVPTIIRLERLLATPHDAFILCKAPWPVVRVTVEAQVDGRPVRVRLTPGSLECILEAEGGTRRCFATELPAGLARACDRAVKRWWREHADLVRALEAVLTEPLAAREWLVAWRPEEEKLAADRLAAELERLRPGVERVYEALCTSGAARRELNAALRGTRLRVQGTFLGVATLQLSYRNGERSCSLGWMLHRAGHVIVAAWAVEETSPRHARNVAKALAERAEDVRRALAELSRPGVVEGFDALDALARGG